MTKKTLHDHYMAMRPNREPDFINNWTHTYHAFWFREMLEQHGRDFYHLREEDGELMSYFGGWVSTSVRRAYHEWVIEQILLGDGHE